MHIEGHGIDLLAVPGSDLMDVGEEFHKAVHIAPDILPVGVEDMRSVFVDGDALDLLAVGVSADVGPLIDNQTAFAVIGGFPRKGSPIQPSTNDEKIIPPVQVVPDLLRL